MTEELAAFYSDFPKAFNKPTDKLLDKLFTLGLGCIALYIIADYLTENNKYELTKVFLVFNR